MNDPAFDKWLSDLVNHLVVMCEYTPEQAKAYVTDQPECWRDFFDDGYTPQDAAFEDATS